MSQSDQYDCPAVSIILPTYNRASFLPQAFEAIWSQTYTDWELIVVDDGSTDDTQAVLDPIASGFSRPLRIIRQTNQGAYGARNTGLDHARGRYVAFYDSDDCWLPHHLSECVAALEEDLELDWVFSACRRVDSTTGKVLEPNTFYTQGKPWPFLRLRARSVRGLRILDDPRTLTCMISAGLNCGLQASVIRRRLFDNFRFNTHFRNEAEDQMTVIWALANGHRMAYFDEAHVVYNVHADNSSATASRSWRKRLQVVEAETRGYEELSARVRLPAPERRSLRRRLCQQYFWQMGYALLWQHGERRAALEMFRRGLRHWPWDPRCWKTYIICLGRARAARQGSPPASLTAVAAIDSTAP
jgi:glycosyltransferase involved in cell wall biosynthesis